ncbi:GNAT family N-acetyltransferase [Salarchaeum sp. JOR-1]|uniref:GNAT family N-acetyltransferase n=1 Tax=Salarchaeum sp. JOR-1 TaxID=2599399 RepID=UPI0011985214|nr:GNAT family N-acetyltransferase [Salarchaeum sp. JOR-1]QDX39662.1 GNAT family N-acetyltransferase [Salarchaeum sp. JOR-1]
MEVRDATDGDVEEIRAVARASLDASYADALGEDAVEGMLGEWYDPDRLADRLAADGVFYVVAAVEGAVVGFAEVELDEPNESAAEIQWLHVRPDNRGEGVGEALLERAEERALERGANRVEGVVLAANDEGNAFYHAHGYERVGTHTVDVGGESFDEHTYGKRRSAEGPVDFLEEHDLDGETVYVALDERERGSEAPFYVAYTDDARENKYGYYCSNCGSFDIVMNAMERMECGDCENSRKPSRWDAAYL